MKILKYPHPALRVKGRPLTGIDAGVTSAARAMLDIMYQHDGLGLAAQQVGLDYQMLVINFAGDPKQPDQEVVAINPVLLEAKGVDKGREGCLSFPNLYQDIRRAKSVRVQAIGLDGQPFEMTCTDLAARVWQHEIDHLNGILYIDKMGPLARMSARRDISDFIDDFEQGLRKGTIPPGTTPKY